jgi:alanine-synthesizing transaminase
MSDFHRVKRLPPYVFEQVNRIKAVARAGGADIIDLGMGNPDLPAPAHVVQKLCETAGKPRTDRYSASKGIAGLRRAQAGYYGRRFGVKLNPDTQVVATLGSKEGFANMAQAITAPGDVVLVPNPSYPIHAFGFLMAGGVIRSVPAEPTPAFFPALERAVQHSIPKPIALVVCYPSNPTAYVASLDFYRDLVAFARRHELILLSDLAYAEVYFDDAPPPSVLQVPGAMEVAVEFTSMSKTFSMAGWRIGFAVGNERLLAALTRVKSYLDYGAFTPVQVAATAALNGPEECIAEMRATYKRRRDVLVECFGKAGWPIPSPTAGARQPRVLEAPRREGRRRGGAGHRLWRIRRRLRADRARRERAAHPPGRPQHPPLPRQRRPDPPQRRPDRPGGVVRSRRADGWYGLVHPRVLR